MSQVFPSYFWRQGFPQTLFSTLLSTFDAVWAPVVDDRGCCRLEKVSHFDQVQPGKLSRLPLKKLLLPAREPVWSWDGETCVAAAPSERIALFGLPRCELQGAWYLDRVFADEFEYQRRRRNLFLVGFGCHPEDDCRCGAAVPVSGDLFVNENRVWLLSEEARDLAKAWPGSAGAASLPLPVQESAAAPPAPIGAEQFRSARHHPVWQREAVRCLSCGACSAVCPTCYCFDLVDAPRLDGSVDRYRTWDNCFFARHGEVAGGHDFRAGRAERLRFRFEHKQLGFGELRGMSSCVGCGRCRQACPVDIDLDAITVALRAEAGS